MPLSPMVPLSPLRLGLSVINPDVSSEFRRQLLTQARERKFSKIESLYFPVAVLPPVAWVYACSTCTFYKDKTCAIVNGEIQPYAWCALWINLQDDKPFSWIRPSSVEDRLIQKELSSREQQAQYFKTREKTGDIITPEVYQPVIEPISGNLAVIFVESGATHLVFEDEIAPQSDLNARYKEIRQQKYGRTTDVESVEFLPSGDASFYNNASLIQPYETSFHYGEVQGYDGKIYSNTWNHMFSTKPGPLIIARGGYRKVSAELMNGGRANAESWKEKG